MVDDFSAFAEIVPDGAIPMYGFLIVAYMDPDDGVVYDHYQVVGDATTRDALGTLDSTKFRMAFQQWDVVMRDD